MLCLPLPINRHVAVLGCLTQEQEVMLLTQAKQPLIIKLHCSIRCLLTPLHALETIIRITTQIASVPSISLPSRKPCLMMMLTSFLMVCPGSCCYCLCFGGLVINEANEICMLFYCNSLKSKDLWGWERSLPSSRSSFLVVWWFSSPE